MSKLIPQTDPAPMSTNEAATRKALMIRYGLTEVLRFLSQRYPHTGEDKELAPSCCQNRRH